MSDTIRHLILDAIPNLLGSLAAAVIETVAWARRRLSWGCHSAGTCTKDSRNSDIN
ncbi:hypothetical protein AW27_033765 (plasmid) [Streptomyces sp. PCS3-D2]|uniref:hypothetical protein n=1 Tax=Streptomyces sp. PCS3-D2 TaxID=1460244 RepID=UPI00272A4ED0|nr:hypothetical protein [Streptomyces sp. PCS3-D2]WKV76529.1 hypothetical protein AW27_033765 [Streptomyces sp. PCS3-D2]